MIKNIVINVSRVILVDFSNLMLIYANSYKQLNVNVGGINLHTGTLYGFTNLVENILKSYKDCIIVFCLDSGDSGRKILFPGYKSERIQSKEKTEIFSYKDKIFSVLSVIPNVYFASANNMECDDVISNLAFECVDLGKEVVIYSRDNDFAQLIQFDHINLAKNIKYSKFEYVSEEYLLEKFGVTSSVLLYFRVLEGDKSDSIPKPILNMRKNIKIKFCTLWKMEGYNQALKSMYEHHKEVIEKLNTPDVKKQIKINIQLMDLTKYRKKEYRFPVDIFKGDYLQSKSIINEYHLEQYRSFLNNHYPNYI